MDITNLFSILPGLLILTGCALLWLHHRSVWTVLMLAGEGISIVLRVLFLLPGVVRELPVQDPMFRLIWPIAAMIFAIGLVGHALTQYEAAQRGKTP